VSWEECKREWGAEVEGENRNFEAKPECKDKVLGNRQEGKAGNKGSAGVILGVGINVEDERKDDVECMENMGREEDEIIRERIRREVTTESEGDRAIGMKGEAAW